MGEIIKRAFIIGAGKFSIAEWQGEAEPQASGAVYEQRCFVIPALLPYALGTFCYDPFETLHTHISRAEKDGMPAACAVWSALESDLNWFVLDASCGAALDACKGSPEWRRFAVLNDMYRRVIQTLVPVGIAPPAWNAWQRNETPRHRYFQNAFARLLSRPLETICPILARYAESGQ